MIQPGDTVGDAVLEIAKDETAEPDIFTYCSPIVADSDPRVMVRTCKVPHPPYLFSGYAELANTQEELESLQKAETWQLYFDEHAVDVEAFGYFDRDWEGYRLRRWKIAVEYLSPGEHSLRYIITNANSSQEPLDVTWVSTMGEARSSASPTLEKILYPTLSAAVRTGQPPYTSEKSGLNFWLYLPASYGRDTQNPSENLMFRNGRVPDGPPVNGFCSYKPIRENDAG